MALVGVAAFLVGAFVAALAVAAGCAAGHDIAVAARHFPIGDGVGTRRDGERVVAGRVCGGGVDVDAAGGSNHQACHWCNHTGVGQTVGVALDPNPVAKLGRLGLGLGGKAEGKPIIVLTGTAGGIDDLRRTAYQCRITVACIVDGIVARGIGAGQRLCIGRGQIVT